MDIHWKWVCVLVVANLPLYYFLARVFFKTLEDFEEAIYFWVKPDFWSALQGEYFEDKWAEVKLAFWVILCAAAVYSEYRVLPDILLWFGIK